MLKSIMGKNLSIIGRGLMYIRNFICTYEVSYVHTKSSDVHTKSSDVHTKSSDVHTKTSDVHTKTSKLTIYVHNSYTNKISISVYMAIASCIAIYSYI